MYKNQDELLILLKKIEIGNETAMAHFYDATINRVYGVVMKIVTLSELAEEVVSDVYLQVWLNADKYDAKRASLIGWLLMISRSRALDRLRREKSAIMEKLEENTQTKIKNKTETTPLNEMIDNELSQQLVIALKVLNSNQRQTIALAFYQEMSHQQISDYMKQPLGTVKSNIRRAQAILKQTLNSNDFYIGGNYGTA